FINLSPPTTHLFPYTTLFRSQREAHKSQRDLYPQSSLASRPCRRRRRTWSVVTDRPDLSISDEQLLHFLQVEGPRAAASENRYLDRKSTRLNSSHVAISYAVF